MTDTPTAPAPAGHRTLDVPQRALEVDLDQAFSQLLYRASLLQRLRAEEAQTARATQRDLLGILVEVDDALAALGLDRELVLLGRGTGIEATRRRLLGRLAKAGVRPMRLEGLAADPALTEIVGTEPRPGVAPETVVRTVVTGFFWEEEVLRRAQVVVAAVPEPAPVGEPVLAEDVERALEPAPEQAEAEEAGPTEDPAPADPEPADPGPTEAEGADTELEDGGTEPAVAPVNPAARATAAPPRARRKGTAAGGRRKRKK
ncbi:nucleotide exchange factor GrpE [Kitasatospora sp. NPDC088861]|uniref:nucleotide exchange factor GrpE n=1 Tax=Kitasatospora sp. NPDC088861 TaxID=3364078 RepID=UPI00382252C9